MLPNVEVVRLDAPLGPLDRARHEPVLDDLALLYSQLLHDARDPVRAEEAHQVVFEREVKPGMSRIALAPASTAELAIDAPALVPLGPEDMEPARELFLAARDVPPDAVL